MNINSIIDYINENSVFSVEQKVVNKNGIDREALVFTVPGTNVQSVIYVDTLSPLESDEETAMDLIRSVQENSVDNANIDLNFLTNWDEVRGKLRVALGRDMVQKGNGALLSTPFLDLYKYVYIPITLPNGTSGKINIPKAVVEKWGVTASKVFETAEMNNIDYNKHEDLMTKLFAVKSAKVPTMIILSNDDNWYGASTMLDTDLLDKVGRIFGSDFYILPSSVHELIAVPKADNNPEGLLGMIKTVNETELLPDEILSYSLYCYLVDKSIVVKYSK